MADAHANDTIDRDGFRANVGIVLMRRPEELFLGGRVGGRGWQFPQGGVNRGERVEEALFRELKEEIGLGAAGCRGARARRADGCAIGCRANTCATAASARSSAGFC